MDREHRHFDCGSLQRLNQWNATSLEGYKITFNTILI